MTITAGTVIDWQSIARRMDANYVDDVPVWRGLSDAEIDSLCEIDPEDSPTQPTNAPGDRAAPVDWRRVVCAMDDAASAGEPLWTRLTDAEIVAVCDLAAADAASTRYLLS
jgi:hypothetical protein